MSVPISSVPQGPDLARYVRAYWNERIHDLEMTRQPVGSRAFFDELDEYRFDKLAYLPRVVNFAGFRGRRLLEIGCGIGTDLVRFAAGGARVTGVDLSTTAIGLARKNRTSWSMDDRDLCSSPMVPRCRSATRARTWFTPTACFNTLLMPAG
jgi:hypothetical protein